MRFYEDYRVGETFRTKARTISPEEVDRFVEYIGVRNPLFLDAEHASRSPFRTRIIPGFQTQSLALGLMYAEIIQDFLLLEARSRFLKPVHVGDTIHVEGKITSKKSGRGAKAGRLSLKTIILNQENTRAAELNLTISLLKRATQKTAETEHSSR